MTAKKSMVKKYSDWVKKLGQWHLSDDDVPDTLCGAPMLGNNYARIIPVKDRQKCPRCWAVAKALEQERL